MNVLEIVSEALVICDDTYLILLFLHGRMRLHYEVGFQSDQTKLRFVCDVQSNLFVHLR
jgi:hypothetical protein